MILRLATLLALALAATCTAGPGDDAWQAFLSGDFTAVEKIARQVELSDTTTSIERGRVYFALASVEAMRGREVVAMLAMRQALLYYPGMVHRQSDLPPPVWRLYSTARSEQSTVDTSGITRLDSLSIPPAKSHQQPGAWRSLILPGWGHIYEGDYRGYWYGAATVSLAIGAIIASQEASSAREDYLKSRDEGIINSRYESYNERFKIAWAFGSVAVISYLATQVDFFIRRGNSVDLMGIRQGSSSSLKLRMGSALPVNKGFILRFSLVY
ncbi:MAG: hypothetical protein FJY67_03355 [Calditrichaeota bacterium]|nr:hypothetical protein [Calditrichota bacterium]